MQDMTKNNFLMWGERGLVTTFLLDLSQFQNPVNLSKFLGEIELADGKRIDFQPKNMKCIIEPDFGNQGFGHPDAIIILQDNNNKKITILLEAKRVSYNKSSKNSSERINQKFNSSINGQLELNYCLTLALTSFISDNNTLEEPSWILRTNYNDEREGELRKVINPYVIEQLAKQIICSEISSYYHIILTNEDTNPLNNNFNLPELYDENNNNMWENLKSNFGWINYTKLKKFAENHFKEGKFIETFNLNSDNMGYLDHPLEASRGTMIIYAPTIKENTLLHLSWKYDTSILRNYIDESSVRIEHRCKTSEIKDKIELRLVPGEIKSYKETKFWYNQIQKLYKNLVFK